MLHKYKIVGFGNSLTNGYLVRKGYLDYLYEYFKDNVEIINSGIPGDTILDGIRRIEYSVLKYNPDITIIEFALNDAFSGITVPNFKKVYQNVLDQLPNIKIIMIPHLTKDKMIVKFAKPYYETLRNIAEENLLSVIDLSKYTFTTKELLADGVHPNEEGYKIYAKETINVLKEFIPETFYLKNE